MKKTTQQPGGLGDHVMPLAALLAMASAMHCAPPEEKPMLVNPLKPGRAYKHKIRAKRKKR